MEACIPEKQIGSGMTSDVYLYGEKRVLKLFKEPFGFGAADYEEKIAGVLNTLSVQAPRFYERITCHKRAGLVYEMAEGISMLELITARPLQGGEYMKKMAETLSHIHSQSGTKLPSQQERFTHLITAYSKLDGDIKSAVLADIASLPRDTRVCHGDCHPDNIIVSDRNIHVIDWMNAYTGSPAGDAARTFILLSSPILPDTIPPLVRLLIRMSRKLLVSSFIKNYCRLTGISKREIQSWIPLMAALRLTDRVPGEKKWLMSMVRGKYGRD